MRLSRPAAALLAAAALLLTGACNSDQTGDSVTENQQNEPPQPETSPS
jgi:predicted small secreted protein